MSDDAKRDRRKPDGLIEEPMQVLERLNDGTALAELMENLRAAAVAVLSTRRPATLKLSIRIEPTDVEEKIVMLAKVDARIPQPAIEEPFYARNNGDLSTRPFTQGTIDFAERKTGST